MVVPLVPKEGVDAVSETGRLLAEARVIRRATVDEAYTRRLLKGAGTR